MQMKPNEKARDAEDEKTSVLNPESEEASEERGAADI